MQTLLEHLQFHWQSIDSHLGLTEFNQLRHNGGPIPNTDIWIILALVVGGLALCFLGLLLLRLWSTFIGLGIGATIAVVIATVISNSTDIFSTSAWWWFVLILVLAVVIAFLFAFFRRVGAAFCVLCFTFALGHHFLPIQGNVQYLVAFLIAVIAALITLRWISPFMILSTTILGALFITEMANMLLEINTMIYSIIFGAFTIAGLIVQLLFLNGKHKRAEHRKAQQTSTQSRSSEVDSLRGLDHLEELPEEKESPSSHTSISSDVLVSTPKDETHDEVMKDIGAEIDEKLKASQGDIVLTQAPEVNVTMPTASEPVATTTAASTIKDKGDESHEN